MAKTTLSRNIDTLPEEIRKKIAEQIEPLQPMAAARLDNLANYLAETAALVKIADDFLTGKTDLAEFNFRWTRVFYDTIEEESQA